MGADGPPTVSASWAPLSSGDAAGRGVIKVWLGLIVPGQAGEALAVLSRSQEALECDVSMVTKQHPIRNRGGGCFDRDPVWSLSIRLLGYSVPVAGRERGSVARPGCEDYRVGGTCCSSW